MGPSTVGCAGTETRLEYTAIGNVVNLASRLCSPAGNGQDLMDSAIADAARVGVSLALRLGNIRSAPQATSALGRRGRHIRVAERVGPATAFHGPAHAPRHADGADRRRPRPLAVARPGSRAPRVPGARSGGRSALGGIRPAAHPVLEPLGVGFRDYGADVAILVDTVSRASPIANACLSSSPDAARPYYRQYRGRRRRLSKIAA